MTSGFDLLEEGKRICSYSATIVPVRRRLMAMSEFIKNLDNL
jgi:hypothetical protein